MRLSKGQVDILEDLKEGPQTANNACGGYDAGWGFDRAHSVLRRLEDRGLVRRVYRGRKASLWEITAAGRERLQELSV